MVKVPAWHAPSVVVVVIIASAFFFLIVLTAGHYGFYGDELYYIACSKHLDFGYVDHPPLVALLAWGSRVLFGETLLGLRIISGLAGAFTVLLSARLARLLGGSTWSQIVSALLIVAAPSFPALSSFFSMNAVDITLVTLFFGILTEAMATPTPRRWITLGVIGGIGALNKYTFLVLAGSLVVAFVLTRRWEFFKSPWAFVAGALACLLFLPHVVWQIAHGWPTLEFMRNATQHKNLSLSLLEFTGQLVIGLNPLTFPFWTLGLGSLLVARSMRPVRVLGWTALIFLGIYASQSSKFYYVVPVFPLLMSAGAVQMEELLQAASRRWIRWAVVTPVILGGLLLMPLAVPLLSPDRFIAYSKTLGLWNAIRMERWEGDTLPLHFLFRFGWEELVGQISTTVHALPADEQNQTIILTSWYASAAAVDFFGPSYGLPHAISPHNSYWLWGPDMSPGTTVIAVGFDPRQLAEHFETVEYVTTFTHPYALSQTIYLCRNLKGPIDEVWKDIKSFG